MTRRRGKDARQCEKLLHSDGARWTADVSITVRNINLEARLRLASYSAIN
jgi:hypothetical protein